MDGPDRVKAAVNYSKEILKKAIDEKQETEWLEKKIPEIIKILDIDSLLTIPVALPWMKQGMPLTKEELLRVLIKISKNRESDFGNVDPKSTVRGENIFNEFKVLLDENMKNEGKGLEDESIGVQIPSKTDVNETTIYEVDLINNLKIRFKEWKSGWKEHHLSSGDEFDEETYIDGHEPFFTDIKKTIKN